MKTARRGVSISLFFVAALLSFSAGRLLTSGTALAQINSNEVDFPCRPDAPLVVADQSSANGPSQSGGTSEVVVNDVVLPPRLERTGFELNGLSVVSVEQLPIPDPCDIHALGGRTVVTLDNGDIVTIPGLGVTYEEDGWYWLDIAYPDEAAEQA